MLPVSGTFYNEKEKTWYGPKRKDLYNSQLTVGEVTLMKLYQNPKKIIQIMDPSGEKMTAKELADFAVTVARNLLALNIKPKDVVGLYAQNTKHVATVMLASFLCGAPVNALYPGFDVENVCLIYGNTRPKVIFCDVGNYENAREADNKLKLHALIYLLNGEIAGVKSINELLEWKNKLKNDDLTSFRLPCYDMSGADIACITCSSGTTGIPKGVLVSHYALLNKEMYANITADSIVFVFSTMYWTSGVLNLLASFSNCVTRIVTDKPSTPEYFLYLVERYKITHNLSAATAMAELVFKVEESKIRKALQSIDTLMCGGAKVPEIVQNKMYEILSDNTQRPGFCVGYGMSELSGWLTASGGPPYEFKALTEGKLAPNDKVRIIDQEDSFLGPNQKGELLFSSPYKFAGYFKNPEATKKALNGEWVRSGDIGYFDEDGFLYLCGREKEVFKCFGFQIYPQAIEENVLKIPGISEVCVVPIPDFIATNLIGCAVVRSQDKNGLAITKEAIEEYIKGNMSSIYHINGGVHFLESLPKTGSGKIQRRAVLDLIHK